MFRRFNVASSLKRLGKYLVRKILVYDLALVTIAVISFIFTGNLTPTSFSERIFWIGVIVFLIAGVLALSHMVPPRLAMFPYNIRRPEEAKKFIDQTPDFQAEQEKRLDAAIQFWMIGLVCLGIAALVQTLLS